MRIDKKQIDKVVVLSPHGKILIGQGDVALREAVAVCLEEGARAIALNMKEVTLMDSSGIGELISAYTTIRNRGGRLVLSELPSRIYSLLQITQLITVFEVYDTVDEAVASFE